MITYRTGNDLDLTEVIELYRASTLGKRRPIDDRKRMAAMLKHANLIITAWDKSLLVGISRSLTDFSFVTYLADLAVRDSYQRKGVGEELIRRTRKRGANGKFLPKPLLFHLRHPNSKTNEPKFRQIVSPKNRIAKKPSFDLVKSLVHD